MLKPYSLRWHQLSTTVVDSPSIDLTGYQIKCLTTKFTAKPTDWVVNIYSLIIYGTLRARKNKKKATWFFWLQDLRRLSYNAQSLSRCSLFGVVKLFNCELLIESCDCDTHQTHTCTLKVGNYNIVLLLPACTTKVMQRAEDFFALESSG